MRLAARAKLGYYPCPEPVLDIIARRFGAVDPNAVIVDPCAGKGDAVMYLANKLGLSRSRIVANELDVARSRYLAARLPEGRVTQECDFTSAGYPYGRATIAYVNPPFDKELGHNHRCEATMLKRATKMLARGGTMIYIVPEPIKHNEQVRLEFTNYYSRVVCFSFPSEHRKYREVVIMARRKLAKVGNLRTYADWGLFASTGGVVYDAGPGGLFRFTKRSYTDIELESLVDIEARLESVGYGSWKRASIKRPPLQLKNAHRAFLLAAGHLNGRIQKPGEPPHVVRGTSTKHDELISSTFDQEKGTKTDVLSERISLVIRQAFQDGTIKEITSARND